MDLNDQDSPWRNGEPDDQGSQNCVEYKFVQNDWNDIRCNENNRVLCEKSCSDQVQESPTDSPSETTLTPTLESEYEDPSSTLSTSPYIETLSILLVVMVLISFLIYRENKRRINLQERLAGLEVIERYYGIDVQQNT